MTALVPKEQILCGKHSRNRHSTSHVIETSPKMPNAQRKLGQACFLATASRHVSDCLCSDLMDKSMLRRL